MSGFTKAQYIHEKNLKLLVASISICRLKSTSSLVEEIKFMFINRRDGGKKKHGELGFS